jgi:YVTN family beta-propeller protein
LLAVLTLLIACCCVASAAGAAPRAYVTNRDSSTLSVVDTSTNTVVNTISLPGATPYGIVFSHDGNFAYVTSFFTNTVLAVDLTTNTVADSAAVGGAPAQLSLTPDGGHLYVANNGDVTISVIDTATFQVVATIPLGSAPQGPQSVPISPDGTRAYAIDYDGGNVAVIDTSTNAVITTIAGFDHPFTGAVTPDGSQLYVSVPGSSAVDVAVISTATNTVVNTIHLSDAPIGLTFSPDGTRAYVSANNPGGFIELEVIDTAAQALVNTITVGGQNAGLVHLTPDGKTAYVPSINTNQVFPVDLSTRTVGAPIAVGSTPLEAAVNGQSLPIPVDLELIPNPVRSGKAVTGQVTLNQAAGSGGVTVTLSSSSPDVTAPASVVVLKGALSATFRLKTRKVSATTSAVISATANGKTTSKTLTVTP